MDTNVGVQFYLFYQSTDPANNVCFTKYNGYVNDGSKTCLTGLTTDTTPALARENYPDHPRDDKLWVIARNVSDQKLYYITMNYTGVWSSWTVVYDSPQTAARIGPAAITADANIGVSFVYIFARVLSPGCRGGLRYTAWTGQRWLWWQDVPGAGCCPASAPAVTTNLDASSIYLFDALFSNYWVARYTPRTNMWSYWQRFSDLLAGNRPFAGWFESSNPAAPSTIWLFGTDRSGSLYLKRGNGRGT
jgi:hypothetical protein